MLNLSAICSFSLALVVVCARNAFVMDDRFVCIVKTSCFECLKLPQCSWCPTENKCFSRKLPKFGEFCSNNTIAHVDYGFSFEENAECSCSKGDVGQRCFPPGVTEGLECSGRGTCVCGQCVCNPNPDPENPTKMVMGEYCEYDNFSCDDPKCNEGPYSLSDPTAEDGPPRAEVETPYS
uniref:Integrin beta epidermal growth factor-like domain-containing protein n=1 Tax=Heliothis virescens TaxID=7102 RepID=A0A2A4JQG2_HELVI